MLRSCYDAGKCALKVKGNGKTVPLVRAGYEVHKGNFDGKVTRNEHFTGTYAVDADCTGNLRYRDGTRYDLFLDPDGKRFAFVQTNSEFLGAGFEPRTTAERVED